MKEYDAQYSFIPNEDMTEAWARLLDDAHGLFKHLVKA